MKRKIAIAFASLLLLFSSAYKAGAGPSEIPILSGIFEAVESMRINGDLSWAENLKNIATQTEKIIQTSLNTYTTMDRIVHSSSVLDAVYNGASLLGIAGPKSVFYQELIDEVYASLDEYQRLLATIDYYSRIDANFDVNEAAYMMTYGLEQLKSLTNYVDGTINVIRDGSDAIAAQRKLDEAREEAMKKRLEMAKMKASIDKEYVARTRADVFSACLSSSPEAFNSLKPATIPYSNHFFSYNAPASTGKLNYSGTASGGNSGSKSALSGSEIDNVAGQLEKKGRKIIDENNEDVKKPKEMFRRATVTATNIAEVIVLILGIFFIARNYSRRQGDGHQYQNSMLKTIVGTFVIILICEIIKALVGGAPTVG